MALEGWRDTEGGKEQLGGVQSAPFLGHRAEPLSRTLNYQAGVRILMNHRAEGCQALPGPFLVLRARCAESDGEAGPVGTGTSSAAQPIGLDASKLHALQTLVIQLQIKCALEEIAMTATLQVHHSVQVIGDSSPGVRDELGEARIHFLLHLIVSPELVSGKDVGLLVLAPVEGGIHAFNIRGQPQAGQWLGVPSLQGAG